MKLRFTQLFMLMIGFTSFLAAQVIYEDNFESYSNGDRLVANANNNFWDTWSSNPGSTEDAVVSNAQAVSGTNSARISGTNDIVLLAAETPLTSGRYLVTFKMFVEDGRQGYYNLLHLFAGGDSDWATQSYYPADGGCSADADGGASVTWNQPTGEWFDVRYIIDLEDDFVTYYHNSGELKSWRWSAGSFGSGTTMTFHAINFYAWAEGGTPEYYIDDVKIEQVDKPGIALTLSGMVNGDGDIEASWNTHPDIISYIFTNNSDVLPTLSDSSALIQKPYPGDYSLQVAGHFGQMGYRFSEPNEINIAGGMDREFMLLEIGTGTWCPNCPSTARGADDMHATDNVNIGILEYHEGSNSDPFIVPASTNRVIYYDIDGFPTSYGDGVLIEEGGSYTGNDYQTYLGWYNQRLASRPVIYDFNMELTDMGSGEYRVDISIEELANFFDGDIRLRIALTESNIAYAWQGLQKLDFVLRDMYPDGDGVSIDFTSGLASYSYTFQLPAEYIADNCEVVAFLQHEDSKEVLNGRVIRVEDALSSVNEVLSESVELIPNPIVGEVVIKGLNAGQAYIYAQSGALVKQFQITSDQQAQNLSDLSAGSYTLTVETKEGLVAKKMVKL